jgi:activator of HSP90 ATPase
LELVPGKRIIQGWRASEWPEGAYPVLPLELSPRWGGSRLIVDRVGISDEFRDGAGADRHEFYWKPMKRYFGERAAAKTTPARRRKP